MWPALYSVVNAMPFVAALLLGILLPALGVVCFSHFGAGIAVVSAMFAAEILWMTVGGVHLGVTLYYTDIVLLFVGIISVLRLLTAADTPRVHWAWVLYVLAFMCSFGAGLVTFGVGAGVQARAYFYSIAAGSYAMSFPVDAQRVRQLLAVCVTLALLIVGVCAYRWIVYYTPITNLLPEEGVYNNDGAIRVVRSFEALVLAQVFVASLFFVRCGHSLLLARSLSPVILCAVLALQHRSVWLALMTGLLTAIFVARSRSGSRLVQIALLAGILVITALPVLLSERLAPVKEQVTSAADRAVGGEGSVGERFDNWQGLIRLWANGGPKSILFGQSFGSDSTRYVHDQRGGQHKITYFAHNHYVQTLYNLGLFGLTGFLVAAGYAVRRLYGLCSVGKGDPTAEVLITLLVMQLVYYVPYGTDYLQSTILGLAMAYVAGRENRLETQAPMSLHVRRRMGWGLP